MRRSWIWIAAIGVIGLVALALLTLRGGSDNQPAASDGQQDVSPDAHVAASLDASTQATPEAAVDAQRTRRRGRLLRSSELRALRRRHRRMIDYCFEREARGAWIGRRRTEVAVQLKDGGRIGRVDVRAGGRTQLEACLRRVIRAWRFSASLRAQPVTFTIVFTGSR